MTDALAVLAAGWGVFMALSPILQIRHILNRRSSADVSLEYLWVLIIGFVLWIAYGIALNSLALIIPNGVALMVGSLTIAVAMRYRHPAHIESSRVEHAGTA
jgi:uncharacterized protein with PQ loop repeat